MGILDKRFKYVPAVETDVRKTIAREHKRLAEVKRRQEESDAEAKAKVEPLRKVGT